MMNRCTWPGNDPDYIRYHDEDWGVPVLDGKELFAKLILDGAQAGLSWITILRKRPDYYRAFDGLDPDLMAGYDRDKVASLLSDPGIVRNKLKIEAAITNAQSFLSLREKGIDFGSYLWKHVDFRPLANAFGCKEEVPTSSAASDAMSKELKRDGFKFVGTTICYAFMQAVGMVQDHITPCYRHQEIKDLSTGINWSQAFRI
ncbi:MAG: DNA-3-methyladenine glycosylase I [Saprospiraceae bacterium]|nr:DNA-3-methyladenine glycosylase I [Saprospiraceae bacterium]